MTRDRLKSPALAVEAAGGAAARDGGEACAEAGDRAAPKDAAKVVVRDGVKAKAWVRARVGVEWEADAVSRVLGARSWSGYVSCVMRSIRCWLRPVP